MDKGYHSKSTSLGRAVTALTTDASLVFYNPAAIGFETSGNVFTNYANLYPEIIDANMNVLNAGGAYSLGEVGVVGVSISQFAPEFWSEQIFVGSFATRMFDENLSIGSNLKILRWSADAPQGENAVPEPSLSFTGFTFDLGATYIFRDIFEKNDVQIGCSVLNLTQPSIASNGSADAALPMEINIGGAYVSRKYNYTVLSSATLRNSELKIAVGAEVNALTTTFAGVESIFLIRFGGGKITVKDSQGEYNGGFGLQMEGFTIDYSFSYQAFIQHVGGISSISLGYQF